MSFTLTRAQVRELDRRAIDEYGLPGIVLMENAGRGCAELLMRLNPEKDLSVILCGPGNNGGDGFVMARHLDNAGWPVEVWLFAPGDQPEPGFASYPQLSGDNYTNYALWIQCDEGFAKHRRVNVNTADRHPSGMEGWADVPPRGGWVVDALFGTGLSRPLGEPFSALTDRINTSGDPVLAIDIPSGLDCDTGDPLGPMVRATHTVTFVAPKRGFLNPKSGKWTGEVHVIDIGAPRKLVDEYRHGERSP